MMELLAPAGSPEAVAAAVENGAGAVYLGCGDFNARRRAKNFTPQELEEAVKYCHVRGAKVYLTLNTLVEDRELSAALEVASLANSLGVDAVLVQDLGLASLLRAQFPDLPLHASTQMTVHSLAGVELCRRLGLSRVVLSRELSRAAIAHICARSPVEIEVFVHGALCMCYSGQCFLSSMVGGRGGNRGLCAQPCRLPYALGGEPEHPLSLKDMSLAGHLQTLEDMGVACVKIEGRMKRPEYVAVVTRVYAAALRERREPTGAEMSALETAFSRSGFTQGYFLDQKGPQMFGVRWEAQDPEALYAQARTTYQKPNPLVGVDLQVSIRAGSPISAAACDGVHTVRAQAPVPQAALRRETTREEASAQLSKTGGTPYFVRRLQLELDGGLSVPKSLLNQLRRDLLEGLSALRAQVPPRRALPLPPTVPAENPQAPPGLVFTLRSAAQLTQALWSLPHSRIDLPAAAFAQDPQPIRQALAAGARLSVALPRVCWDAQRPRLEDQLRQAAELGVRDALVGTWDAAQLARELGFTLHGDFGLGVYNSAALDALKTMGFQSATASFELKLPAIRDLRKVLPVEAVVYGRLPLMLLEQPPGGQGSAAALTDRKGFTFPLVPAPEGRFELLNSQVLYLADKPGWDRIGLTNLRLLFTLEAPADCVRAAQAYLSGGAPPKAFTRGLYYRDVE